MLNITSVCIHKYNLYYEIFIIALYSRKKMLSIVYVPDKK